MPFAACGDSDPPSQEEFREAKASSEACREQAGPPDITALPQGLKLRDGTPAQERRLESFLPAPLPGESFELKNLSRGGRNFGAVIIAKVDPSAEGEAEEFVEGARGSLEKQGLAVTDLEVGGQPAVVARFGQGVGLVALGQCEGLFVFAVDEPTAVDVAEIYG